MQALIIAIVIFILSFVLTWCLRIYALKNNVIDVPNQRSSHSIPTPRGGGVAIVISMVAGLLALSTFHFIALPTMLSLIAAGGITAIVGFLDDHGHIAARWRLLMHFLAAASGLFFLGQFPAIDLFGYSFSAGWLGMIFGLVYLVWMLNLYNFMDGINGLASMEAIVFSLSSLLIVWISVPDALGSDAFLCVLLLGAAALGFIFWNFPNAKIFMGDAGSGFLGITIGLIVLHISQLDSKLFLAEICLLGVFIVDATLTLLRRLLAGKKVYEAHASHGYQILARKYGSHKPVTLGVLCVNLIWLTPFALMIASGIVTGVVGVVVAWLPVVLVAWRCGAGVKDKTSR
ncbi:Undecaprenyl-phosphate alpha-N-acetylglucosaminyl 1-phosphate transferase [Cedecea lapagei]|uniref:Undecaprenyl-phosphate alpha-N-acetylglucosaminyl 1-phosphate transferase n=1 Tax=Cedecea lapagei TaxID=158823 RepID=A0A3S4ILW9_9ENTR|nr:glycosyltransferase family 4 protein [Cedecea lapagei]VEB96325.1 Undecaprenyl-phosphate alpha-N-acetylglucosaminyl 1-phosphate transferase [Cedecea lapagei]